MSSLSQKILSCAFYGRVWFQREWAKTRSDELKHQSFEDKLALCLGEWSSQAKISLPESIHFLSCLSKDFPQELREVDPPVLGLFVRGDWRPEALRFAVVGSRKPNAYSLRVTRAAVKLWVEAGFEIVSGGAFGIDAEAHRACLDYGGKTLVVMGSGFDHLYPKAHYSLFQSVLERGGAWISEYSPSTEAHARFFPERNRIIAALSHSFFLAQAHEKSGSMITAKRALELGREIFVLRPPAGDANFAGSLSLIQAGAIPLSSPEDWMRFYRPDKPLYSSQIESELRLQKTPPTI